MLNKIIFAFAIAGLSLAASFTNAGDHASHHEASAQHQHMTQDIVSIASENKDFETLVAAVTAAGLVDTLKDDGPYTVFAPTDDAFAALPEGTLESLLKPENKDQLISILTYHVVPGRVKAEDVVKVSEAKTVQGGNIQVISNDQGVLIDGAKLVATDIEASNGVIHVIDKVILPKS